MPPLHQHRVSYPVPSIYHQTLLSKALYAHSLDVETIAAVASSSKSIQNSSLAPNLASCFSIENIVRLFAAESSLFHPSSNSTTQFTHTLRIANCWEDRIVNLIVALRTETKYFNKSLRILDVDLTPPPQAPRDFRFTALLVSAELSSILQQQDDVKQQQLSAKTAKMNKKKRLRFESQERPFDDPLSRQRKKFLLQTFKSTPPLSALEDLTLRNYQIASYFPDEELAIFGGENSTKNFPNLKSFTLMLFGNKGPSNTSLEAISNYKDLTHLQIANTMELSDEGIALFSSSALTSSQLDKMKVQNNLPADTLLGDSVPPDYWYFTERKRPLRMSKIMELCSATSCSNFSTGLQPSPAAKNLKSVDFHGCVYDDMMEVLFANTKSLEKVGFVTIYGITDKTLEFMAKYLKGTLKSLSLYQCDEITGDGLVRNLSKIVWFRFVMKYEPKNLMWSHENSSSSCCLMTSVCEQIRQVEDIERLKKALLEDVERKNGDDDEEE